jgi:hypothetical protein
MGKLKAKYAHLLKDRDIRRWYENLGAKSVITASVYLRALGLYCQLNRTDPKEILRRAKTKAFRDGFSDFVRELERQGKAGSYIARFKKVLHSWLSYNGLNVKLKVNIVGEYDSPTLDDERIPDRERLERILRFATPRARVSIALMAFSGLRPESLGDYLGTDGLKLGDFADAEMDEEGVRFPKVPAEVVVRKGLSKARHQYFTFVPEQGITYIEEYLQARAKRGERLGRGSPLLGFDERGNKRNSFLRTNLVTRDIKEAITKAGYDSRP